jgi:hypothetical protein
MPGPLSVTSTHAAPPAWACPTPRMAPVRRDHRRSGAQLHRHCGWALLSSTAPWPGFFTDARSPVIRSIRFGRAAARSAVSCSRGPPVQLGWYRPQGSFERYDEHGEIRHRRRRRHTLVPVTVTPQWDRTLSVHSAGVDIALSAADRGRMGEGRRLGPRPAAAFPLRRAHRRVRLRLPGWAAGELRQ